MSQVHGPASKKRPSAKSSFHAKADRKTVTLDTRQDDVMSHIKDAAGAAKISSGLLGSIWGIESRYGRNLHSPTGARGDFQFTQETFANMIHDHGDVIAARLKTRGHHDLANKVVEYRHELARGKMTAHDPRLQALRNNPAVSTYAAAFLMADTADWVNANPRDQRHWGRIYAGYNIGPQAVQRLQGDLAHTRDAGAHLGSVARANPQFFHHHATGQQVLRNYQAAIERHHTEFSASVGRPQKPTILAGLFNGPNQTVSRPALSQPVFA